MVVKGDLGKFSAGSASSFYSDYLEFSPSFRSLLSSNMILVEGDDGRRGIMMDVGGAVVR